jgi:menaquinone-dependent protoporphyrinogen oxidase
MSGRVLVSVASRYGGTAEIAQKIAEVLREAGVEVDARAPNEVADVTVYDAVVLGSGVYIGRWRREAVSFVNTHQEALAQTKVWIFSSGPTGEGDPVELLKGWTLPTAVKPAVDRIDPQSIAVFHGVLDHGKLSFVARFLVKKVGAPVGDFRDWEAITSWAREIAEEVTR